MSYIILPSNSSLEDFPNNTLSRYKTQLPVQTDLEGGDWEVGLAEIQYVNSWFNVVDNELKLTSQTPEEKFSFVLPPGQYYSAQMLVDSLNTLTTKTFKYSVSQNRGNTRKRGGVVHNVGPVGEFQVRRVQHAKFGYDNINRKVNITVMFNARLQISTGLAALLGFTQQSFMRGEYEADQVMDLAKGFFGMYVYCDLVEPRTVGHTRAPLLRIVPIEGQHGDTICKTYSKIQYVPVLKKSFQNIEIDIRKDTGKPVPFEFGKVVVTLHLRKKPMKL